MCIYRSLINLRDNFSAYQDMQRWYDMCKIYKQHISLNIWTYYMNSSQISRWIYQQCGFAMSIIKDTTGYNYEVFLLFSTASYRKSIFLRKETNNLANLSDFQLLVAGGWELTLLSISISYQLVKCSYLSTMVWWVYYAPRFHLTKQRNYRINNVQWERCQAPTMESYFNSRQESIVSWQALDRLIPKDWNWRETLRTIERFIFGGCWIDKYFISSI